uniref:Uncharacterized protein n=1 Tax=Panagrellus redivivus TaxID=6233 RepID=A0A7E4VPG7_PANRE
MRHHLQLGKFLSFLSLIHKNGINELRIHGIGPILNGAMSTNTVAQMAFKGCFCALLMTLQKSVLHFSTF